MTGVILVNMLINTEETIGTEAYLMTNNFSLSDAAAIARADALQTFNYNLRKQLENYLTIDEEDIGSASAFNVIKTDDIRTGETWEKLKQNFEKSILLAESTDTQNNFEAVIQWTAERTINQFVESRYGKYNITLDESDKSIATTNLEEVLIKTIRENREEIDFLEIVGCNESECEIGTFYFIIPLDKMKPEEYEKLPLIVVKDLVSGEEIKFPILPKTRLNIYVPLRFFKAIYEAWKKNSSAIIDFEDLLNNGQTLKTGMLGYCDIGCEPRNNPLIAGGTDWESSNCIGISGSQIMQEITNTNNANSLLYNSKYVIGQRNGANELNGFARANICSSAEITYSSFNYHGIGGINNEKTFLNYNLEESRGLPEKSSMGIKKYANCPFNNITTTIISKNTKVIEGTGAGATLDCASIKQVNAEIIFEDNDLLYLVSGTKNFYAIGITSKEFPTQEEDLGICINGSSDGSDKCKKK